MSSDRFRVTDHVIPGQHIRQYPRATSGDQNAVLNICLKQYTPIRDGDPPEDAVTIIGAHANGFPKETYEPFWDDLLEQSRGKFHIRGIWIADVAHQGDSYVENEYKLGDDPSWLDHSRDLLQMINYFRMPRPLVGIGHSFGGCQIVDLALYHPRLFTAVVLLDPVMEAGRALDRLVGLVNPFGVVAASTLRRDLWKSIDDAKAALLKNRFYSSWDPRVLERLIQSSFRSTPTAIYPDESGSLTLKTTKHQEVWTFGRPNFHAQVGTWNPKTHPDVGPEQPTLPFYRPEGRFVHKKLPALRPPAFYILAGQSPVVSPERSRDKVKLTGIGVGGNGGLANGGTKDVTLAGIGHLVPMEAPRVAARYSAEYLEGILREYAKDEQEYRDLMAKRTIKDNLMVSDEWMRIIKENTSTKNSKL